METMETMIRSRVNTKLKKRKLMAYKDNSDKHLWTVSSFGSVAVW